jgi:hypothetical protein
MALTGYQVVCESISEVSHLNPAYRGIYRRPPWSQELYNKGYDDPYVFGDYVDEHGLIPTIGQVREALQRIAAVIPDKLEVIQVSEVVDDTGATEGVGGEPYGFDVAHREAAFWSLLVDYPPEDWAREFLPLLNQHGLFEFARDAQLFRERCLTEGQPDLTADSDIVVWRVRRIPVMPR